MEDRYDPNMPGGGHARGSGGAFHLSFRSGSRAGGASGAAAFDYVTRNDKYDTEDRDPAIYTESDHMPSWAQDDPREYWDAADLYERANGRLYVSADFALPRELSVDDQIAFAREFAHELTDEEHLPYTLAIHEGRDQEGHRTIPHAHLMFSERQTTGSSGSAPSGSDARIRKIPSEAARPRAARFTDLAGWSRRVSGGQISRTRRSSEPGSAERVDHRSYERQGWTTSLVATTARPRLMSCRAAKGTSAWTMPWLWGIMRRPSPISTRRSRDSKPRVNRSFAMADRGTHSRSAELRFIWSRTKRRPLLGEVAMGNALDDFGRSGRPRMRFTLDWKRTAALLRSVLAETQTLAHSEVLRTTAAGRANLVGARGTGDHYKCATSASGRCVASGPPCGDDGSSR